MKGTRASSHLDSSLANLKGVGPARVRLLERLGLETLGDLILYVPRRLESSGETCTIAEAREAPPERVLVFSGEVTRRRFLRFGRRSSLRLEVTQGEASIEVVYFNQAWQRKRFEKGAKHTFAGRVSRSERGPLLISPKAAEGTDSLPVGRWNPIYGVTAGLGQELLRSLLALALDLAAGDLHEPLSRGTLKRLQLASLPDAVRTLHAPESEAEFARARRRVLLQDLLAIQARVLHRCSSPRAEEGTLIVPRLADGEAERALALPFQLTAGQRSILSDLEGDLARGVPMRRLLQGDVGAGKTVLALLACARVAQSVGQCAFMAPTELLAEQHYDGSRELLECSGLRAALLTGSKRASERKALLRKLKAGEIDVLFGTHALFSKDVAYPHLVLCVIDEQQRFGVAQRTRLVEKAAAAGRGSGAHLLMMTATPIPRTLALTIYGDLEVCILREKPAGRGALGTRWLKPRDGDRLPAFLAERLEAGERVFWVCPRIGEADGEGALAAFERLSASDLSRFGIELVHGQLPCEERAARLGRFRRGESQLLVATTVIEVGVDVPEATVMVIEEAERLGLAQLHQLRGRVGRGSLSSWCLLFGKPTARERFEMLERSTDGFEIAEEDLKRRGMGELAGLRQSGELGGLLASLEEDLDLVQVARELLRSEKKLVEDLLGQS